MQQTIQELRVELGSEKTGKTDLQAELIRYKEHVSGVLAQRTAELQAASERVAEGEGLQSTCDSLQSQVAALSDELASARRDLMGLRQLRGDLAAAHAHVADLNLTLEHTRRERSTLHELHSQLEGRFNQTEQQLQSLQTQHEAVLLKAAAEAAQRVRVSQVSEKEYKIKNVAHLTQGVINTSPPEAEAPSAPSSPIQLVSEAVPLVTESPKHSEAIMEAHESSSAGSAAAMAVGPIVSSIQSESSAAEAWPPLASRPPLVVKPLGLSGVLELEPNPGSAQSELVLDQPEVVEAKNTSQIEQAVEQEEGGVVNESDLNISGNALQLFEQRERDEAFRLKQQTRIRKLQELLVKAESDIARGRMKEKELVGQLEALKLQSAREVELLGKGNVNYLKNVMVRYIETENVNDHESLLPVISTVLQLTAEEITHINDKRALTQRNGYFGLW